MTNNLNVTTEQVDDIPVLLAQGKKIGIPELLDRYFAPHGNWQGTSLGWTGLVWLSHILSKGDHRLNQVEGWAEKRLRTLEASTGQAVRGGEWSDDRLGIVLDELADDEKWQAFESALNRQTFRVYDLRPGRVRLDSTTASGYWTVTEEGLFQFGHSKDHRPDLPQVKVMLSALDPMGMPVATQVVGGQRADDGLYIPAIEQVSASLDGHGLLYVGDSKMGALATRAYLQNNQDYYLCPLSATQLSEEKPGGYLQPVWEGKQALEKVERKNAAGEMEEIAEGYEQSVTLSAEVNGKYITWTERHLIVRSFQYARATEEALHTRLAKAQAALLALNGRKQGKERVENAAAMHSAAGQIVQQYRVTGLLKLQITEQHTEKHIRAYGDRPARNVIETSLSLQVETDDAAITQAVRWFGWRVYATNHPKETLPLDKAVLAYREEFLVERGFGRLKGKPLSLSPMYLQSDTRATALIRLLSLGLRILTLIEHKARQSLADLNENLAGLYAGNPKRTTDRPTAEAMLQAFKGIYLSVVTLGEQVLFHVSPLSEIQTKILSLLDFSTEIYTQLPAGFPKPAGKLTEP
jgi:transposase